MIQPNNVSLTVWAQSLVIDFPTSNVPLLRNEADWKSWGNLMIQDEPFASEGIPSTELFTDAKEWANKFYLAMANYAA